MDRLATRLRDDAGRIQATVSPEFDARLQASLRGTAQDRARSDEAVSRPLRFHWGAVLTGVALTAALVIAVNLRREEPGVSVTGPDLAAIELPAVPWRVEPAVLTSPLEQEYAHIRSDLKKAEEAVRAELEAFF